MSTQADMARDTMINAHQPGQGSLNAADAQLMSRRMRALGPAYRLFYQNPVHLVRGDGVWLYDPEGRPYLDCYNNVAVVGHCHPRVVAAMSEQAAVLASHTRYLHEGVVDYAERLLAHFPEGLDHVMFTCTGSEANDLAYRIARAATGGTGIIVTDNAYHGVTFATAQMSMSIGSSVAPGPEVFSIPAPSSENYPAGVARGFANAVRMACGQMREKGMRPAMLILDTLFSSDGLLPGPLGMLEPAVQAIREEGGLFVADEVQAGFARSGSHMWGFQRHGVFPDMVSLGKPMGNGYPIAGLVMRPEVIAEFGAKSRYFNTFGGNAVAAATASAVLNVIEEEGLQDNALVTGAQLTEGCRVLAAAHDALGEIRSAGLYFGIDVLEDGQPSGARAGRIVNRMREAGVLISATGPLGHVLKIRPPLVFEAEHADYFLSTLQDVLDI